MNIKKRIINYLLFIVVWPLSALYSFITFFRRFIYVLGWKKQTYFKVPIISIGNISMGGTGKTPLTLFIGKHLESKNLKPMILMRGYKGLLESGSGYIPSRDKIGFSAKEYGDEAILYKKKLLNSSVIVGKNRVSNLLKYYQEEEADIVLLDDGHQHIQIRTDFNILLFDASLPLEKYKVVPLGYLRESLFAISTADVIVINRCELVDKHKIEQLEQLIQKYSKSAIPLFKSKYTFRYLYNKNDQIAFTVKDLIGRDIIAFAGIANPENFFNNLQNFGANIIKKYSFGDHHTYQKNEMIELEKFAEKHNCLIVTTEKDIVKLWHFEIGKSVYYLGMDFSFFEESEKKSFLNLIDQQVEKAFE